MKYFVLVQSQYGSHDYLKFSSKQEALDAVAINTGEDTFCTIIEGEEIKFKITQKAEEVEE